MKSNHNKKSQTFSLTGLSAVEYAALRAVLITANDRCFNTCESDGTWYSNDDFVCSLGDDERKALHSVCKKI